ncbi:ADP-ribose-binding protein [Clostridium sp. JN-1]|uniref:ADP-ribose-binding protein n=1 Tax=Clostridium sp. JN-1 TaxID=2483110 RepID=UPI000F0BD15A|nr:ADP-ribose-binding protein [Clostridium sp. JN-1]
MDYKYMYDKILLTKGDITKQDADAIVNAANSSLLGGGGVDGAIHAAGGRQILEECTAIVKKIGELKTGKSVITSGGNLKSKYVIHTVGPIWRGGNNNEETLLANCYRNSLKLAAENGIETIAFSNISTGVYGFPKELAAKIAFDTVKSVMPNYKSLKEVRFVCFNDENYNLYLRLINNENSVHSAQK